MATFNPDIAPIKIFEMIVDYCMHDGKPPSDVEGVNAKVRVEANAIFEAEMGKPKIQRTFERLRYYQGFSSTNQDTRAQDKVKELFADFIKLLKEYGIYPVHKMILDGVDERTIGYVASLRPECLQETNDRVEYGGDTPLNLAWDKKQFILVDIILKIQKSFERAAVPSPHAAGSAGTERNDRIVDDEKSNGSLGSALGLSPDDHKMRTARYRPPKSVSDAQILLTRLEQHYDLEELFGNGEINRDSNEYQVYLKEVVGVVRMLRSHGGEIEGYERLLYKAARTGNILILEACLKVIAEDGHDNVEMDVGDKWPNSTYLGLIISCFNQKNRDISNRLKCARLLIDEYNADLIVTLSKFGERNDLLDELLIIVCARLDNKRKEEMLNLCLQRELISPNTLVTILKKNQELLDSEFGVEAIFWCTRQGVQINNIVELILNCSKITRTSTHSMDTLVQIKKCIKSPYGYAKDPIPLAADEQDKITKALLERESRTAFPRWKELCESALTNQERINVVFEAAEKELMPQYLIQLILICPGLSQNTIGGTRKKPLSDFYHNYEIRDALIQRERKDSEEGWAKNIASLGDTPPESAFI